MGIPEARRFLEKYYPYITLYGAYDTIRSNDTEAFKVRIAFSRDKDDRDKLGKGDDDWKCEVVRFQHSFVVPTDGGLVLPLKLSPSNDMFPLQRSKNPYVPISMQGPG